MHSRGGALFRNQAVIRARSGISKCGHHFCSSSAGRGRPHRLRPSRPQRATLTQLSLPFCEARLPDSDIVQLFVEGWGGKIELQCESG